MGRHSVREGATGRRGEVGGRVRSPVQERTVESPIRSKQDPKQCEASSDPLTRRILAGDALLRRMNRYGLLDETQNKLDYVLALTVENFLERRFQTLIFKSIHHARVQRHIRVGRQVVNVPFFMVRVDSQKHIDFSLTSPLGGGRQGRVKKRNQKAATKKAAGGDGDEDDEE